MLLQYPFIFLRFYICSYLSTLSNDVDKSWPCCLTCNSTWPVLGTYPCAADVLAFQYAIYVIKLSFLKQFSDGSYVIISM